MGCVLHKSTWEYMIAGSGMRMGSDLYKGYLHLKSSMTVVVLCCAVLPVVLLW